MNIVFATSSFHGGGITSYALEFIKNYSQEAIISVIVGDDSYSPINVKGVNVYRIEGLDISFSNAKKALSLINDTLKPDILINSNSYLIGLLIPYLSDSIKVITISHSLKYIEADIAAFQQKYIDHIVALSTYNKSYLDCKFRIKDSQKVNVIYNFVADGEDVSNIINRKKLTNIPVIIYMGGSIGAKNPELVFRIVKKLLNTDEAFKFYWLGADTPPLQKIQPFKSIAELLPTDDRVVFTHRIPREEAMKISSTANIILIPSRREGCPMALLEAMRYGVITITSDYKNACRELVVDDYNGWVLPHNSIDSFTECLSKVINTLHSYDYMYDNSLSLFNKKLSYSAWKNSMDSLIYSPSNSHKPRLKSFSRWRFYFDKCIFRFVNLHNQVDKMIKETVPSALSFLVYYYYKR